MSQLYDCSHPLEREQGIAAAVTAVRRGDLVVMPTDTVYGLGADAFSPRAVTRLLAAKGRGRDMPVPVLVGSWNTIDGLVRVLPRYARELVEAFWPGGLTLVVEHAASIAWDLGDTDGTVAVRMPLHPVALGVLVETGPMAVSSANISGTPPPPTAYGAREQLGQDVSVYLEGGPSLDSLPSTIVDLTGAEPRVLRPGAVTLAQLATVVPGIDVPSPDAERPDGDVPPSATTNATATRK